MIETILWDVDGTLLDFNAAEMTAIRTLFADFGLGECTDAMLARYHGINIDFWQRLEKKELSKKQVLTGRFEQFFSEYGIDTGVVPEFNERYQVTLGDTIVFCDDSLNIVRALKGKVKQYAVSNGTVVAQTKKLDRSKLGEQMDGIFLSERLGVEKPDRAFFDRVFSEIRVYDRSTVMIVGDSLTRDSRGGMNAGIKTCWYNPAGKPAPDEYRVDHVISDLHELAGLLEKEADPGLTGR
jgi:2-haloacid dehalogenase